MNIAQILVSVLLVKMILPNNNNISFIEKAINNSFLIYKNEIINTFKKSWKEEDNNETSYIQFTGSRYLMAIQLIILVYLDYIRFPSLGWPYYAQKFDLDKYLKCFRCDGINLDKILEQFGLPCIGDGVNFQEIEETLIVENIILDPVSNSNINILELVSKLDQCFIYLNNDCLYTPCNAS